MATSDEKMSLESIFETRVDSWGPVESTEGEIKDITFRLVMAVAPYNVCNFGTKML